MASTSFGFSSLGAKAPPGYQWDAQAGAFVPQKGTLPGGTNTGTTTTYKPSADGSSAEVAAITQNPRGSIDNALATQPQYSVSPTGRASEYNYQTGTWDYVGQAGGNTVAPTTAARGTATSGNDPADEQAKFEASRAATLQRDQIDKMIEELRSVNGGYEAPQVPVVTSQSRAGGTTPYDMAGENAAYADAKGRTGMALQASIRGLRNSLAETGKMGGGAESAALGALYRGGLGELAGTDRQLAEVRAGRAFTANESDTDRTIGQNEFNATATERARQAAQQQQMDRMRMMLSLTGATA